MVSLQLYQQPLQQLSRVALVYLLVAFAATVLSLQMALPHWTAAVATACLGWRVMIHRGRWSPPPRLWRWLLVALCPLLLLHEYGLDISLDLFASMLLLGYALKLLEIQHRRDAQWLLYLGVFFAMTLLIYQQTLWSNLLALVLLLAQVAGLLALHCDARWLAAHPAFALRRASLLLACALPLMAVLFVVVPRIAPLWAMPQPKAQGQTGISSEMSPGDISKLNGSDALVFRAVFDGEMPPPQALYWRALALEDFDGRRWSVTRSERQWRAAAPQAPLPGAARYRYQLWLEPQPLAALYVMAPARIDSDAVRQTAAGVLLLDHPREGLAIWHVESAADTPVAALSPAQRARNLALPAQGNPKARRLAADWRKVAGADDAAVLAAALHYFADGFYYTTEPPVLGADGIDDFLLRTRAGFCEHFAGALVFALRAAGVPARVVNGYYGGDIHAQDHYISVRQFRAHAWAEVWLAERGWLRVDPTSVIPPDHVLQDVQTGSRRNNWTVGGVAINWLASLQAQLDRANYWWTRLVVDYDNSTQAGLLQRLGLQSPWKLAGLIGGGVLGAFAALMLILHWRHRLLTREHWTTRRYRKLCACYARRGVVRLPVETPLQFAARVQAAALPQAERFAAVSADYAQLCFDPAAPANTTLQQRYARQSRRLLLRLRMLLRLRLPLP